MKITYEPGDEIIEIDTGEIYTVSIVDSNNVYTREDNKKFSFSQVTPYIETYVLKSFDGKVFGVFADITGKVKFKKIKNYAYYMHNQYMVTDSLTLIDSEDKIQEIIDNINESKGNSIMEATAKIPS